MNLIWILALTALATAQDPTQDPPAQDPSRVEKLEAEVRTLSEKLDAVLEELSARDPGGAGELVGESLQRFSFGGYGESHANFTQSSDQDSIDNHRFVLYAGYEFADWIQFHSETEIEHSFVNDGDGEISLEQLHTDLHLSDAVNVRIGRFLVPVGITNETHEPTTFYSVERPSVDRVLIPSTWSSDGIGLFGGFGDHVRYQAYIGSGLDGSQFNALNGIRGGRLKERPGINEPGITGRIDMYPLAVLADHDLRLGVSTFVSGLDNGNRGTSGAPGSLQLYSADAQYRFGDVELRGVFVFQHIRDAAALNAVFGNNVAERMHGYYAEAAYHWLPDCWKTGKLEDADAVVFARLEDFDTQDRMPTGTMRNPAGHRQEVTGGIAFFLTSQFVLKGDYVYRDDQPDLWNLGVGWRF